jgi:hypothetical protein
MSDFTDEQRRLLAALDTAAADSELSGYKIDPRKIERWKAYVIYGMPLDSLLTLINGDPEKGSYIVSKIKEFPDYPGMKSMGNGYYLSGDDPEDPPVK